MSAGKAIRCIGAACAIGLTMAISSPTLAHAAEVVPLANTTDRNYYFDLSPKGDTGATKWYRKDNTSSVYVYIQTHKGIHRMYVDGAKNDAGSGWKDCTATTYRARKNGQWRMRNNVRERGFSFARLSAWAESASGHVQGKWSPDSSKSWPEMGD